MIRSKIFSARRQPARVGWGWRRQAGVAFAIAAAALGNARGAIEELVELAAGKVGQGSGRTLAARQTTQAAVAEAEASLRAPALSTTKRSMTPGRRRTVPSRCQSSCGQR